MVCAALFGVFDVHRSANDGLWALFYAANWHALLSGQSYAALFSTPSPLLHFWSLAVEEQYYLVFPLVCWWCARRRAPRTTLTLVLLAALAMSVHGYLAGWSANRVYYGTDVRMGEIALGALLAISVERARCFERRPVWLARTVVWLQLPALAIAGWVVCASSQSSRWLYEGGLLAMGLCWVVLVLGAVLDVGAVHLLARVRPLVWLGVVSYGVYLVHWPLLLAVHPFADPTADAFTALAASLVLAGLSYRFFENPIRFGDLSARMRRSLTLSGAAAVAMVGAVAVLPAVARSTLRVPTAGAAARATHTPPRPRGTSPSVAPLRVLVIGDSTGENLGRALVKWSASNPEIDVENAGVAGCALADATDQNMVREQLWAPVDGACRHWALRVAALQPVPPDVVLAVFGPTQAADLRLAGSRAAANVTQPDEQAAVRSEVLALRSVFPKATFVWATAPRTFAGSRALPEGDWLINDATRIATWNFIVNGLGAEPRSATLDVAGFVERAPGGWHDPSWRPDGTHLSGPALSAVTRWTATQLEVLAPTH